MYCITPFEFPSKQLHLLLPTPFAMPQSRRQSILVESAPSLASKSHTAHTTINDTPPKNSAGPPRVISSEPRDPRSKKHPHTHHNPSTQSGRKNLLDSPAGSNIPTKKSNGIAAGGLPSSRLSGPAKRHFSSSDGPSGAVVTAIRPTPQNKKKKLGSDKNASAENPPSNLAINPLSLTPRCHQCHTIGDLENLIACSNKKAYRLVPKRRKSEPIKEINSTTTTASNSPQDPQFVIVPCTHSFCARCLSTRYGQDLKKLRPTADSNYDWICPICEGYCNCSPCRKKKGLPPTGKLTKAATEAGCASVRELLEVNPHAQGAEMLIYAANKREKERSNQSHNSSSNVKTDKTNKKAPKSIKSPGGSTSLKTKKPINTLGKKISHKKKLGLQDQRQLEAIKRLKKQQQLIKKSKAKKSKQGEQHNFEASSSGQNSTEHGHQPKKKTNDRQAAVEADGPKQPVKRPPHTVPAPVYSCLPTGILSSRQIELRLHVREFLCRFKDLIPGLGGTEIKNQPSKIEAQRAEKIIDSMDDLLNFWIDDEGGMRAIMNGLAKLIESDHRHHQSDLDPSVSKNQTNHSMLSSSSSPSLSVLKSENSPAILAQLKRECKFSTAPSPYLQSSVPCWLTAKSLLEQEGFKSQLARDTKDAFLSSSTSANPGDKDGSSLYGNDDRLQKVRFPPINKVAIVSALIDLALRGHTLSEDLNQGLEREKQAKSDIFKERAKLNKKWAETRAGKLSNMPSKKTLLCNPVDGSAPGGSTIDQSTNNHVMGTSQELIDQEAARVKALSEWEADMNQAEEEHKSQIRKACIEQYKVEASNRLRFQSIGEDTRRNSYYILSSTPGRIYPNDPIELGYSWSYSLIIHGSEPANLSEKLKTKKKKKTEQMDRKPERDGCIDEAHNQVLPPKSDGDGHGEGGHGEQVDMLEGSQRALNDQWMRVSDPKEIRQLALWIEYEAKLIDFKKSYMTAKPNGSVIPNNGPPKLPKMVNSKPATTAVSKKQLPPPIDANGSSGVGRLGPTANDSATESNLKAVTSLVDQINRFADFVDLKIHQHLESIKNDRRSLKSRT